MKRRSGVRAWWFVLWLTTAGFAQSAATGNSKLTIDPPNLPPATPQHAYRYQLTAKGGIPPMRWELLQGELPPGLRFSDDGVISGTPVSTGEWRFMVGVADTSRPPQAATREIVFKVLEPLMLEWKTYPKLAGNQILGSVAVSNGTDDTFDFTLFVVAVSEIGKAFALGYQRFPLRPGTSQFEIPFGQSQNLPQGNYFVHVDAVGEVEAKQYIYRRRLQTKESFTVAVGP